MKIKNLKDNVLNEIKLLVVKIEFKVSKKQEDYAKITFSDGKNQINAFMWNINKENFELQIGLVYNVYAYAQEFNSKPVLKIIEIKKNEEINILSDFVKTAVISQNQIQEYIESKIATINEQCLKKMTQNIVNSQPLYYKAPAAANNHHAYLTGMSYHVFNMLKIVDLFDLNQKDYDVLVTAIILHDIGKCYELQNDLVVSYTTTGNLLGHLAIGYEIVYKYLEQNNLNCNLTKEVLNLILAHHGKIEYGNLKLCQSRNEHIINVIDTIDAYLNSFIEKLEENDNNKWSDNIYALNNRKVFKHINTTDIFQMENINNKLTDFVNIYKQRYKNINENLVQQGNYYTSVDFPLSFNKLLNDEHKFSQNNNYFECLKHIVISCVNINDITPMPGKILEAELLKWFKVITTYNLEVN